MLPRSRAPRSASRAPAPPALLAGATTAALALALLWPLSIGRAHDDHAPPPAAGFDPNAPRPVSPATAALIGLRVAEIDFGALERVVTLAGVVRPGLDGRHLVAPRLPGVVTAVTVMPGDLVEPDQMLVEIDSPDQARGVHELRSLEVEHAALRGQLQEAESRVERARLAQIALDARADIADEELLRLRAAGDAVAGAVLNAGRNAAIDLRHQAQLAGETLAQARREVTNLRDRAAAMLRAAEALQKALGLPGPPPGAQGQWASGPVRPGLMRLTAPARARVLERRVEPGQGVEPGVTLLALADPDWLSVEAEAPESLLPLLARAAGAPARLRAPSAGPGPANAPGEPGSPAHAAGTVRRLFPAIDPAERSAHVLIDVPTPDTTDTPGEPALRPGQFVEATIVLERLEDVVVAPRSAIVRDGPRALVLLETPVGFKPTDVALGASDDRVVEIREGLVPGDRVVVAGAHEVWLLRPTPGPAPAPSSTPASTPTSTPTPRPDPHGHHH